MDDSRQFLDNLVKTYYPETYARLYGGDMAGGSFAEKAVVTGVAEKVLGMKELRQEAKRLKIRYFNSMNKPELLEAVKWCHEGKVEELGQLIVKAKERFDRAWAGYQWPEKEEVAKLNKGER